ncbi:MAG: NTP transferase domain-containing protein [Firmicutes bacterium]|nr:NTP transferase domain-containing protein [Bacillota bacterium]
MTKHECDIIYILSKNGFVNQRTLSEETGLSLGLVNRSLKNLENEGYLSGDMSLTEKAKDLAHNHRPKNAIILAAGFGMRMVPINHDMPKALLVVHGEVLIERLIGQLKDAGISNITIVVGFMMEKFEYLIDKYGVELIANPDYTTKNNLHSVLLVEKHISDTYIVPCDLWFDENPFREAEFYSWYMLSDKNDPTSNVRANRGCELVKSHKNEESLKMVGLSYISKDDSERFRKLLATLAEMSSSDSCFWEDALFLDHEWNIFARVVSDASVFEINTYEDLREFDNNSNSLNSGAISVIADALHISPNDIRDISILNKGMTNRSFLFWCHGQKYIMRIPGEGTGILINRKNEAAVYEAIKGKNLCDDPVYLNPENGYKITRFLEDIRVADAFNQDDIKTCMKKLKEFHDMKLKVNHSFDIYERIDFYENLWEGRPSIFSDYAETKAKMIRLKEIIDSTEKDYVLTHIDAICDNFLFHKTEDGTEGLQLTDWEYSGMQDPHVDIAMFCIYSYYDKEEVDNLIDIYFDGKCDIKTRRKIYCYIAICGFLWSNWTEYKRILGVEFGEYGLRQYRYAKDYYKYAMELCD